MPSSSLPFSSSSSFLSFQFSFSDFLSCVSDYKQKQPEEEEEEEEILRLPLVTGRVLWTQSSWESYQCLVLRLPFCLGFLFAEMWRVPLP